MRFILVLLCLCLPALAQEEVFELQYTTPDGFLQITADHPVDKARCQAVAERVLKAFDKFLTSTQGDAAARLQGTMWQGLALAEGTPGDEG